MTPEQFEQLKLSIQDTVKLQIKETVNGKIDGLRAEVQNYISTDTAWKAVDEAWKVDAQPAIDLGKDVKSSTKGILWILGAIITILTVVGGIVELIKLVK